VEPEETPVAKEEPIHSSNKHVMPHYGTTENGVFYWAHPKFIEISINGQLNQ
jgi:hypothetical protein